MHPYLLQIGPFSLSSYGVAMALAFLLMVWLSSAAAKEPSLRAVVPMGPGELADWASWAILGGIAGGRLLYVVMNWDGYRTNPLELIAVWHGGLIWYGGFAGGVVTTAVYLRRHGYGFLAGVDQVIPFVALGHAIGRIGCFFNGCCYGKPTTAWCGVQFPGHPQPVVPTQLFESASLVALFVALRLLQTPERLRRPGQLFGMYLISYGIIRWIIEYWRDLQPIVWHGLTIAQVISAGLVIVGAVLILRAERTDAGAGTAAGRGRRAMAGAR